MVNRVRMAGIVILVGLCVVLGICAPAASALPSGRSAQPADGFIGPSYADLVAVSPNDVWGVGALYEEHHRTVTLAEHWDGSTWTTMTPPNPGFKENELAAVSAVGPDDLWAVGHFWPGSGPDRLLAEHWDGSTWSQVRVPQPHQSPKHSLAGLFDVDAVASDDVWAVGYLAGPVIEHWDGTDWSSVQVPPGGNALYGVSATAAGDVWTVGRAERSRRSLIWHWDGAIWTSVKADEGDRGFHSLVDVAALSRDDVWAVGSIIKSGHPERPLIVHWDGAAWRQVRGVRLAGISYTLSAVSGSAPNDVWAVGNAQGDDGYYHGVLEHWDGRRWRFTTLPAHLAEPDLYAVSADAVDDAWLQGSERTSQGGAQVVGRWDGTDWRRVESP